MAPMRLPVAGSQRRITEPTPADASVLPSGLKATPQTAELPSFITNVFFGPARSQSFTSKKLAEARSLPSGLKARAEMEPSEPPASKVVFSLAVATSQSLIMVG